MVDLRRLRRIAEEDFSDIVESANIVRDKLRVLLYDGSYIDFWWSTQIPGRFAYHWERTHIDGKIYRHDNMPHSKWASIQTFPQHFHRGSEQEVIESRLSPDPEEGLRQFLEFARTIMRE